MLAGASVAGRWGVGATVLGALVGAVGVGASDAVARARQRPGEIPALWARIVMSVALAVPLGWAAGRFTGAGTLVVGIATGLVVGVLGVRPQKVVLGPLVGAAVGWALAAGGAAIVAGATVLVYRTVAAVVF